MLLEAAEMFFGTLFLQIFRKLASFLDASNRLGGPNEAREQNRYGPRVFSVLIVVTVGNFD